MLHTKHDLDGQKLDKFRMDGSIATPSSIHSPIKFWGHQDGSSTRPPPELLLRTTWIHFLSNLDPALNLPMTNRYSPR